MVATESKSRTVRALRGGQMTIPIEIRKSLSIDEDTLLRVEPTDDGGFVVHPVTANPAVENAWMQRLYDVFEPVRRQIAESGISEDELDALIDESVEEARARRYARYQGSATNQDELDS
jgi:bifunctional DNA-binding transcriptional regulator/antitoxin component of YhaV-PrlF toxin-antitoxin module